MQTDWLRTSAEECGTTAAISSETPLASSAPDPLWVHRDWDHSKITAGLRLPTNYCLTARLSTMALKALPLLTSTKREHLVPMIYLVFRFGRAAAPSSIILESVALSFLTGTTMAFDRLTNRASPGKPFSWISMRMDALTRMSRKRLRRPTIQPRQPPMSLATMSCLATLMGARWCPTSKRLALFGKRRWRLNAIQNRPTAQWLIQPLCVRTVKKRRLLDFDRL